MFDFWVQVHGVRFEDFDELVEGLVDEDDGDEGCETLLSEAGDVPDQCTKVKGHNKKENQCNPYPDPKPEGQEVKIVVTKKEMLLKMISCHTGRNKTEI